MIAKKCLGQNFIQNPHIISQIVEALSLDPVDRILEVGPGPSVLTLKIVPYVTSYFAIEIDHQFQGILESIKRDYQNFQYVIDDFLKVPIRTFLGCNKFVGNLPYNISTPILYRVATETKIETLVCMFALGTAERFLAKPGSSDYSAGSILAQSFFEVEKILFVSRTQFNPQPKVDSMILRFKRKKGDQQNIIAFNDWVQPIFSYRRKTMINSLIQTSIPKDMATKLLEITHILPKERIENISLEKLQELFVNFQHRESL